MDWNWEIAAGPLGATTEGPAWTGESLLFTCIPRNQVLRYDPVAHEVTEFRRFTNRINGLAFGPDGSLYGCQSNSRRIVRLNPDGSTTPLPFLLNGHYHNQPNDLVVDSRGRIWFSDPFEYSHDNPSRGPRPAPAVNFGAILRLDPDEPGGWALRRITHDTTNPNGVALSPDERTLFVAETSLKERGVRQLRAYPILDDGTVGPFRVLHDFGSHDARGRFRGVDGMTVDAEGNVLACAGHQEAGPGPMIYAFSPTGRILETHPVPADKPTNIAWGGPDLTELYVTTIPGHLFRVRDTGHHGHVPWPRGRMLH